MQKRDVEMKVTEAEAQMLRIMRKIGTGVRWEIYLSHNGTISAQVTGHYNCGEDE